jgi:lipopolysaccharide transport system ATP-binding protein
MTHIRFTDVDLEYPVRENQTITLKEFILRGKLARTLTERVRTIKALCGVSFEIHEDQRVGIIGLNGAGKSTLLRTIAGIYPINRGVRSVAGSICSLFDIASGFDNDATGWENIYHRSYLQGETPREVRGKLKEIEEFTELGSYLNLPIRCYSTGMVMRLAFAIATSRQSDILLVDEVFSTGDLLFQKKAETRMRDFLHQARIVVMVGHDLGFLQDFCTDVIWLHHGRIHAIGPAHQIIAAYQGEAAQLQQAA